MNFRYRRLVRGFFVCVASTMSMMPATFRVEAAAADDVKICTSDLSRDDARLAACNRLLAVRGNGGLMLSRVYLNRAQAYLHQEDIDRGLDDLNKAASLEPRNDYILIWRGEAWFYKGDLDRAMADADRAAKMNPKSDNALLLRGKIWSEIR